MSTRLTKTALCLALITCVVGNRLDRDEVLRAEEPKPDQQASAKADAAKPDSAKIGYAAKPDNRQTRQLSSPKIRGPSLAW